MPTFGDIAARFADWDWRQSGLWGGLGVGTLLLIVVLQGRWKRLSPLHKCTIFSVWGHFLLVIYATSVQITAGRPGPGDGGDGRVTVRLGEEMRLAADAPPPTTPLPATPREPDPTIPRTLSLAATQVEIQPANNAKPQAVNADVSADAVTAKGAAPNVPRAAQLPTTALSATAQSALHDALQQHAPPSLPELAVDPLLADPLEAVARRSPPTVPAVAMEPIAPLPETTPIETPPEVAPFDLPPLYQQRTAADRGRIAAAHGGSQQTEEAVNRALRWLSENQEPGGRWSPTRFGAGQETVTLGQNRGGAGAKADSGITGLALLAFLGAGQTHQRGDYRATVGRGLEYLTSIQHADGNLGGQAEPYAFMYCHGMATLALSEALAMSGDARLRPAVERAIGYTLRAQNRATGGWRYRPNDLGDTSQLGWQLMALKSAELAGIEFPTTARQGIERFVAGVSSGPQGGLAAYRPGEQVSRTMTAEALVVRQFLGQPRQTPAFDEAGRFLLGELPGTAQRNYYYWYYGTLAMYQLQGEAWRQWNDALTRELLGTQSTRGDTAGSWDPNDLWGGYGGRIYSTSLATLCLEVYYRYLPLYVEAAANGGETSRK